MVRAYDMDGSEHNPHLGATHGNRVKESKPWGAAPDPARASPFEPTRGTAPVEGAKPLAGSGAES